jgi:hypothetical protein
MTLHETDGVRYFSFDSFPQTIKHAIFTRHGGVSVDPWKSLNVGGTVGDDRDHVIANRHRSFRALRRDPLSLFDVWQVHSADVVVANAPHPRLYDFPEFKADAIVTDNPQVTLYMRFADCVPILLYDPKKHVAGIVHAGWLGTVREAVSAAIKAMRSAFGSSASDLIAGVGPSIGPDHYEVGDDVIDHVHHTFDNRADELLIAHGSRFHFDLWSANRVLLERAGVEQIEVAGICTACHTDDWFSHRAEKGKTGRFGALIALL